MTAHSCDTAILDLDILAAMYGDDSLETVLTALTGFHLAATGYVADLERSGMSNNLADVKAAAHSLKGICGLVGAQAMAELCSQMEQTARSGQTEQLRQQLALLPHHWLQLQQQLLLVLKR